MDEFGSEHTWDGLREAQLRASAESEPAERLELVEEMIALAFDTGALPTYRIVFRPPVEVRVDPARMKTGSSDPQRIHSLRIFSVRSVSLCDGTARAPVAAHSTARLDAPQGATSRLGRRAVGEVLVVDADGQERCLSLDDYIGIVGLDGELANRQPVDWQGYERVLAALHAL